MQTIKKLTVILIIVFLVGCDTITGISNCDCDNIGENDLMENNRIEVRRD